MTGWNLPPGCTLADIDRLFADVEDQLSAEPLTPEQVAEIQALLNEPDVF